MPPAPSAPAPASLPQVLPALASPHAYPGSSTVSSLLTLVLRLSQLAPGSMCVRVSFSFVSQCLSVSVSPWLSLSPSLSLPVSLPPNSGSKPSHSPLPPGLQPEAWVGGCSSGPSPSGAWVEVSVPESLQAEEGSWCLHKLLQPCRFFQLSPTLDWATPREGTHPLWAKWGC